MIMLANCFFNSVDFGFLQGFRIELINYFSITIIITVIIVARLSTQRAIPPFNPSVIVFRFVG